jgi:DNA-binding NtrC family response regulator
MGNLLIIEQKPVVSALVQEQFSPEIRCDTHSSFDGLAEKLRGTSYDVVVWQAPTSVSSPQAKQAQLLELLGQHSPDARVIVLCHNGKVVPPARMNLKNFYYVQEPIDGKKLSGLIASALKQRSGDAGTAPLPENELPFMFEGMLVASLVMRQVVDGILEAAATDVTVLITGATGTGKDLVAAAIHKRSKRKEFPYVPVNTGAMTPELIASELFGHERGAYTGALAARPGYFEQADRGTIFLDEISTMDEKAQISLLRVLETKNFRRVGGTKDIAVDVRVVAATNEDLQEAVKQKRFREDLYYRLDVVHIHLPPLRQRPGAVALLTDHYVSHFNGLYQKTVRTVAPETYRYLRRYPWPGNVRELKNVIQRSVVMSQGPELTPDLLPARIREASDANAGEDAHPLRVGMTLEAVEKELIRMTLAFTKGNKKAAGIMLGISRRALYNKLKKYGLNS